MSVGRSASCRCLLSFFVSSRRRHTMSTRDWSSDVCSSDLEDHAQAFELARRYENWPVCDMVYVAIAERAGTEFVTADARLRARLAHLGWVKLPAEATVGG